MRPELLAAIIGIGPGNGVAAGGAPAVTPDAAWWHQAIWDWEVATASTGFNAVSHSAGTLLRGFRDNDGVQNRVLSFTLDIPAGTYTISLLYFRDTNNGIATVSFGGVAAGTIDMYGASQAATLGTVTGVVIPSDVVAGTLSFTMSTKNASASAYVMSYQLISIDRTA